MRSTATELGSKFEHHLIRYGLEDRLMGFMNVGSLSVQCDFSLYLSFFAQDSTIVHGYDLSTHGGNGRFRPLKNVKHYLQSYLAVAGCRSLSKVKPGEQNHFNVPLCSYRYRSALVLGECFRSSRRAAPTHRFAPQNVFHKRQSLFSFFLIHPFCSQMDMSRWSGRVCECGYIAYSTPNEISICKNLSTLDTLLIARMSTSRAKVALTQPTAPW
jgi:hypothetical protein